MQSLIISWLYQAAYSRRPEVINVPWHFVPQLTIFRAKANDLLSQSRRSFEPKQTIFWAKADDLLSQSGRASSIMKKAKKTEMKPHKNATLALKALHIADTKKSKFNAGRRSKWTNRAFILEFEHFKPPKSKDKLESDILCIVKVRWTCSIINPKSIRRWLQKLSITWS